MNGVVPANPAQSDMGYVGGQARGGWRRPGAPRAAGPVARRGRCGPAGAGAGGSGRGVPVAAVAGRRRTVQGLPLIKPPYDRITAYDMNTGEIVWQKTHSSTPDDIKNHPALKGLNLPRLGPAGPHVHRRADDEEPGDCR